MPFRRYSWPMMHCPDLCPYRPPKQLFLDDYAPEREETFWKFCGRHCWGLSEGERPCVAAFRHPERHHAALERANRSSRT